jgi:hypothetical protein
MALSWIGRRAIAPCWILRMKFRTGRQRGDARQQDLVERTLFGDLTLHITGFHPELVLLVFHIHKHESAGSDERGKDQPPEQGGDMEGIRISAAFKRWVHGEVLFFLRRGVWHCAHAGWFEFPATKHQWASA